MDEDFNAANGITVVFEPAAKWINSGNYTAEVKAAFAELLKFWYRLCRGSLGRGH